MTEELTRPIDLQHICHTIRRLPLKDLQFANNSRNYMFTHVFVCILYVVSSKKQTREESLLVLDHVIEEYLIKITDSFFSSEFARFGDAFALLFTIYIYISFLYVLLKDYIKPAIYLNELCGSEFLNLFALRLHSQFPKIYMRHVRTFFCARVLRKSCSSFSSQRIIKFK